MDNNMELSFKMSDEEIEKIKKILCTGGIRHYLLKIVDDEEIDVVEYKEYQKLEKETENLQKQLDYLRSGEYYNQLRFENEMLQNVVDNGEVSKEDKEFIDMTHRNTELLGQQKEFISYLEYQVKLQEELNDKLLATGFEEILSKYKSIIGGKE